MSVLVLVLVALAGGAGAVLRYVIDYLIAQRTAGVLPWGTWLVNMLGSLGLGMLVGAAGRVDITAEVMIVVGGGFLGAFTTFSTWMYESLRLIEQKAWGRAGLNLGGSLVLGLGAAWGGFVLGSGIREVPAANAARQAGPLVAENAELVGNYAIRIRFSDGRTMGKYRGSI